MNLVDLKFIGILSTRLPRFKVKSHRPYRANCRCVLCGDSKKSKQKARGWFLEKDNSAIYYCHNCGASMSLGNFLKETDFSLYDEYIIDRKLEYFEGKKQEEQNTDPKQEKPKFTKNVLSRIKKISSLKHNHPAKEYVVSRKIPPNKHFLLYYAPKFNAWVNSIVPDKLNAKMDEPRLVIPFFDSEGNVLGFAGRSFKKDTKLRYITIMLGDHPKVFGTERVDYDKPYYVFEGQIDSLFLDNSIAMAGADLSLDYLKNTDNATFCMDNEPRNKDIVNRVEKLLDMGMKVCLLPENMLEYGKDINNMVLSGVPMTQLELIIKNHTYEGLEGKLALAIWKRC